MVQVGDAELGVDTVGDEHDPAVLLIGGATSSMDWWDPQALPTDRCGRPVRRRALHPPTGGGTDPVLVEAGGPGVHPLDVDHPRDDRVEIRVRPSTRARREASVANLSLVLGGGGDVPHTMAEIGVPTLVLHGTDDPMFPVAHGRSLAEEIRGARLVELEGMGHEVPPRSLWDAVVPAIVEHTAR